jgi:hypothetical protein
MQTITQKEYDDEVQSQAETLATYASQDVERDTAYEEFNEAFIDLVMDVLDGHNWFTRRQFGPEAHGAIIQHSSDSNDPSVYRDISTLTDLNESEAIVRRLAFAEFEADVIEAARSMEDME